MIIISLALLVLLYHGWNEKSSGKISVEQISFQAPKGLVLLEKERSTEILTDVSPRGRGIICPRVELHLIVNVATMGTLCVAVEHEVLTGGGVGGSVFANQGKDLADHFGVEDDDFIHLHEVFLLSLLGLLTLYIILIFRSLSSFFLIC
jgi:hypothetical protein